MQQVKGQCRNDIQQEPGGDVVEANGLWGKYHLA